MAKRAGGGAKKITLTLDDFSKKMLWSFEEGVKQGTENAEKLARLYVCRDCPCRDMVAENESMRKELASLGYPRLRKSRASNDPHGEVG